MVKLRYYRNLRINFNYLDVEEIIKDDNKMLDAVASVQSELKSKTRYSNTECRKLAFMLITGIIPDKLASSYITNDEDSYTGPMSYLKRNMIVEGMNDEEKEYVRRIHEINGDDYGRIQHIW